MMAGGCASEIVWHKNRTPENVSDRPTNAHEKVFLLTKSSRYFFDADAVRTEHKPATEERYGYTLGDSNTLWGGLPGRHEQYPPEPRRSNSRAASTPPTERGANIRNVWAIPTFPYPEAHSATFPPALAEIPIKAGSSERGCCSECGASWERITERIDTAWDDSRDGERVIAENVGAGCTARSTLGSSSGTPTTRFVARGWRATCACGAERVPCTILDPFAGAGTAGMVAARLGRSSVLIELSEAYAEMAAERLRLDAGLFAQVTVEGSTTELAQTGA